MNATDIDIRPLAARDSLDALTQLLHRAYAPLAAAGMNFSAAAQSADDTAQRAAEGQCFVATCDGQLV
ncbi:MAG TPA: GNAT family N-acetyltransferase, partial [Ideonella sp.]|nr:GNAT family N-acetyltransferase [Ideonella sp.]